MDRQSSTSGPTSRTQNRNQPTRRQRFILQRFRPVERTKKSVPIRIFRNTPFSVLQRSFRPSKRPVVVISLSEDPVEMIGKGMEAYRSVTSGPLGMLVRWMADLKLHSIQNDVIHVISKDNEIMPFEFLDGIFDAHIPSQSELVRLDKLLENGSPSPGTERFMTILPDPNQFDTHNPLMMKLPLLHHNTLNSLATTSTQRLKITLRRYFWLFTSIALLLWTYAYADPILKAYIVLNMYWWAGTGSSKVLAPWEHGGFKYQPLYRGQVQWRTYSL